jgi:hypothetical protein
MAQHTKPRLRRPLPTSRQQRILNAAGLSYNRRTRPILQSMTTSLHLRTLIAAALLSSAALAQSLPSTAPTALPTRNNLAAPIAATPTTERPHHADVTYAAGLLDVRADNSSLNQILQIIGRLTGMKITGGVADQRVFGNYGPALPSVVLATLLDGTGSNMLLRLRPDGGAPNELVLTQRNGGPTPPSPDSSIYADDTQAPPLLPQRLYQPPQPVTTAPVTTAPVTTAPATNKATNPTSIPQPLNNVNGSSSNTDPTAINFPTTNSVPISSLPTPSTTPSTPGIVDAPNPPAAGSTTSPNPGNVATPEQIYQQLKALQQKNSQTTPQ